MVPPARGKVSFEHGIELFNHCAFFECHEVLEDLWRPERGPRRLFLQGVIHLAVGFYHHQQRNRMGAERQLKKGLKKLAGYLPQCEGIDTARLYRESWGYLERIARGETAGEFPRIRRLSAS
jgi:predicted metal-dependent hydrolase